MNWKIIQWRSLNTRVTIFTLIIFVVSLWSLAFYATRTLRTDMERQLGEQQFSTVSLVASDINRELDDRLRALEVVAGRARPTLLDNPAALQIFLEERLGLLQMFNAGLAIMDAKGTAIASLPVSVGRVGVNYMERDYIAAALKEGRSSISQPVIAKLLKTPVFGIATPIRDIQGKVIGVLAGLIDLGKPNFLDKITGNAYGKTGGYILVAPQHRLLITATDKRRIMEKTPTPGRFPMIDRFIDGYEGTGIFINPVGEEVMQSSKGIPVAGWYVGVQLPTAEAFAPIHDMQQRIAITAFVLTVLSGLLTWWMLRRQLAPMLATSKLLATLSATNQPPQPLPITRQDEIGDLIGGFNHLLGVLEKREVALGVSEKFRVAILNSLDAQIAVLDSTGVIVGVNNAWSSFALVNSAELGRPAPHTEVGVNYLDMCQTSIGPSTEEAMEAYEGIQKVLQRRLPDFALEYPCNSPTEQRWFRMVVTPLADAEGGVVIMHINITERKAAQTKLQLAANVFSHAREGITITDAAGTIVDVNEAFTRITGYLREDVIGQNSRILSSGRQDKSFYAAMWIALTEQGHWRGEIWNRRKDGEVYAEMLTISAVKDAAGAVQQYVALFSDITERKNLEEQVRQMAFFDPLTQLPNRRLLGDRLSQAMSASKRSGNYGALMMLDLDNFKPLNDTHGHLAGDLLLIEVTRRLTECVRAADTVARLGGDEFVVMLGELDTDKAESVRQAAEVAEKIRTSLALPYRLTAGDEGPAGSEVEHRSTASIGVALFLNHETSQADLLKQADAAMYHAKDAGRNAIRFHA